MVKCWLSMEHFHCFFRSSRSRTKHSFRTAKCLDRLLLHTLAVTSWKTQEPDWEFPLITKVCPCYFGSWSDTKRVKYKLRSLFVICFHGVICYLRPTFLSSSFPFRSSDPGLHSRHNSLPPTKVRAFIFIARKNQHLLPSSTRVDVLCMNTPRRYLRRVLRKKISHIIGVRTHDIESYLRIARVITTRPPGTPA